MSHLPPRRPATYADIEALPEHLTGELLEGELYVSPKPPGPHILAASTLGALLLGPFQLGQGGPGGWWILHEPELHLGRNVLVPDRAGWRKERLPRVPQNHAFDLAPDWVCEVLSPSTRRVDQKLKPPLYLKEKVRHLWLLDPLARSLEVFCWGERGWVLLGFFGEEDKVRAEPFEDLEVDLLFLWGETRPPQQER